MYIIEPYKYFTNFFKLLKNENDNRTDFKKTFYYILAILSIIAISQIIANRSDPFYFENNKNETFIKDEIKRQEITNILIQPIKQTYFNSNYEIILANKKSYRLNLVNLINENKITKNSIIEKKANDKKFGIINNNIKYLFEIEELNNARDRKVLFIFSIFFSFILIPLILKQIELEKDYEKNNLKRKTIGTR